MPRCRYSPRQQSEIPCVPFQDAEQAWFWFMRSQRARLEGAKFSGNVADISRPCDPDDLYRAVMGLVRANVLGRHHLKVLASFGIKEQAPDARLREQRRACRLWEESLDRLTTVLRKKGIIE